MKNKSVIEYYQDDVCIIPAEIKSMQTKENFGTNQTNTGR